MNQKQGHLTLISQSQAHLNGLIKPIKNETSLYFEIFDASP